MLIVKILSITEGWLSWFIQYVMYNDSIVISLVNEVILVYSGELWTITEVLCIR